MKKILMLAIATMFLGVSSGVSVQAETLSLRGENPLDSAAKNFDRRKQETVDGKFKRSWKQQPPSIPHKIDKEQITLQVNTCLKCHSAENFEKEKAPKMADSHFVAADGKKLDKMDGRRHFCNQCHTPQLNVKPLIENTFKTVKQ